MLARRESALRGGAVATVALSLSLLWSGGGEAAGGRATRAAHVPQAVVLDAGQTLWELAERYAPEDTDPRVYVADLYRVNGLVSPPAEGARIVLPR